MKEAKPEPQKASKGINFAAREYEQMVINISNQSGLPACVIYMVLSRIANEVQTIYDTQATREERAFMAQRATQSEDL